MAIELYKCIKVPNSTDDHFNEGTDTIGGIFIDNDKALADKVQELEFGWWREAELVDRTNLLKHRDSLYSQEAMLRAILAEDETWKVGCVARVGISFEEDSTFRYPGSWKWLGDDCQDGFFIFEPGKSYWLFIEKRPDYTWVNVVRCP